MRTRAIILKRQNTNEYDQLVTCYTEEFGKVIAIAKSILKPSSVQAMHLDLFNLVDFELIKGRAYPIISGAQSENSFRNIKSNLSRLGCGYFFAEVLDKIGFEYQKDEHLWNFLLTSLEGLDSVTGDAGDYINKKQVEFLNILGYAPNLEQCTFCGNDGSEIFAAYSIESKGAVCRGCFLNGKTGIVARDGRLMSNEVLGGIFEALTERRLYSLNLIESVLEP